MKLFFSDLLQPFKPTIMKIKTIITGFFLILFIFSLKSSNSKWNFNYNSPQKVYGKISAGGLTIYRNETFLSDLYNSQARHIFLNSSQKFVNFINSSFIYNIVSGDFVLFNDRLAIKVTNVGGVVKEISLKSYPEDQSSIYPFVFNNGAKTPALNLSTLETDLGLVDFSPIYTINRYNRESIEFDLETTEGLNIERQYRLSDDLKDDSYLIKHFVILKNKKRTAINIKEIFINLGTASRATSDPKDELLNFCYHDGEISHFIKKNDFKKTKNLFTFCDVLPNSGLYGRILNVFWGSVKNQFFITILIPSVPGIGIFTEPTSLFENKIIHEPMSGMNGNMEIYLDSILPQSKQTLSMEYYVGPKEYSRLKLLNGTNKDSLMQFGYFKSISKLFLILMINVYQLFPNYGLSIIIITVLIKFMLWPLTLKATESSRNLSKIQSPIAEIKKRYSGDQKKIHAETVKLFKENKVSPAAGFFPAIIQVPIFLGLFSMLKIAPELRFAHFMWIFDLSMPDTICFIGFLSVNLLPIIMSLTMLLQSKLTSEDSIAQPKNELLKIVPLIFFLVSYNFPSGLVLYWTIQNLITIIQNFITKEKYYKQLS